MAWFLEYTPCTELVKLTQSDDKIASQKSNSKNVDSTTKQKSVKNPLNGQNTKKSKIYSKKHLTNDLDFIFHAQLDQASIL